MDSEFAAGFSARKRVTDPAPVPRASDATPAPPAARRAEDRRDRRNSMASRLIIIAAAWSLGLLIAASILPVYNGESISNSDGVTFTNTTLVGSQGAWVLIPAVIPLLMCGVVWLALRRKRAGTDQLGTRVAWVAVALLTVFALLAILSIGGFVIPAVILLARAVVLTTPPPRPSRAAAAPRAPDPAPRVPLW
jgi:hypothetical protein